MTDIVERLREANSDYHNGLMREAADEIERLRDERDGCQELLRDALETCRERAALLRELIDIEGPQPGTAAWADKVRAALPPETS